MKPRFVSKREFCIFYWKMKELNDLAKEYEFGSGLVLPEVFTQKLCIHLYSLKPYNGTEFDAVDDHGNKIEIKATLDKKGKTSFNPKSRFDYMYWMHFDYDLNLVNVYQIDGSTFFSNSKYSEVVAKGKERPSITLSHFFIEDNKIDIVRFKRVQG